jgi:hypothetical protein
METDSLVEQAIVGLPGEMLVRQGVADLRAGRRSIAACAVDIARSRLHRAGIRWQSTGPAHLEPELELYGLLRRDGGDAYSRYNAILRELVSFESALARRVAKAR